MQTLRLSISLPDDTHPDMELRLSANDADCDVVIALPGGPRPPGKGGRSLHDTESPDSDDYVLGGYAGI
ncbi:hypothetical protein [Fulvimonas soli]|jgi:hypothetical protein|uniref:Uncharacterized protein n=1 Tax=Fulvimonas soli TaxID=155197 RepID=A0A316IEM0_9GAMM|nr:hypothetical protein [Fulvimonas soli]PWK92067.1 hypothetical protein C7456_103186 [Fulvimonas soli]TNY26185.1 hypothetical protein BV497_10100 [Fulvimonas soli]